MSVRPCKLIVDLETGEETIVGLTDEEIAAREAEEQVAAEAAAAAAAEQSNADAIRQRIETAIAKLKTGTDAIAAGTLFQGLTAKERAYLTLLGQVANGLCRLELRALDADE